MFNIDVFYCLNGAEKLIKFDTFHMQLGHVVTKGRCVFFRSKVMAENYLKINLEKY